ncbi:hypothetical protein ES705_02488 [subsurface metagenome]|nr:hypothetical protein [Clostridia bacterium]
MGSKLIIENKMKKKDSLKAFATFLIWFGVLGIFLWALGKSLGWIHSAEFVNMIPYFCGGSGILGISIYCGKVLARLDRVEKDIENIDGKVDEIVKDTSAIKATIGAHDKRIDGIERKTYDNPSKESK